MITEVFGGRVSVPICQISKDRPGRRDRREGAGVVLRDCRSGWGRRNYLIGAGKADGREVAHGEEHDDRCEIICRHCRAAVLASEMECRRETRSRRVARPTSLHSYILVSSVAD